MNDYRMKTIRFRDVLWGSVYKMGMDPARKLLSDQAESLVSYINAWVRRLYPSADFPEWTKTEARTPDVNHTVSYQRLDASLPPMERIFRVFLSDPTLEGVASDTPFRLMENGVHVGFEHGQQVWVKFIEQAPRFTSEGWDPTKTYRKGALTYSSAAGECYKSKSNQNIGHDPSSSPVLQSEVIQQFDPGEPGIPGQPQIVDIYHVVPIGSVAAGTSFIEVITTETPLVAATHVHVTGDTQISIITALKNQLADNLNLIDYTITLDTTLLKITLSHDSQYSIGEAGYNLGHGIFGADNVVQLQSYILEKAAVASTPQKTLLTMSINEVTAGAIYTLTLIDGTGTEHTVEYTAQYSDSAASIFVGLSAAVSAATDPYFDQVATAVDVTSPSLTVLSPAASVAGSITSPGSAYWELVPFPLALADQVMRGAYADLLKEGGQTDKAGGEEQLVLTEQGAKTAALTSQQYDPLTDQERPRSRYKVT
jgi:hypothetical protein